MVNMFEVIEAIKAHAVDAYACVRSMIAYYEIIDGKIVGDVWYE